MNCSRIARFLYGLTIIVALVASVPASGITAQESGSPEPVATVSPTEPAPSATVDTTLPGPPVQSPPSPDEVGAAAQVIDDSGETAPVYFWDQPDTPGGLCWTSPGYSVVGENFMSLPPLAVEPSAGLQSQFIRVYASAWRWDPTTDDYTFLDSVYDEGTVSPELGYIELGDLDYGFGIFVRWEGITIGTLEIEWYDQNDNIIGYAFLYIDFYDNTSIGGSVEDACYFTTYVPTPTPMGTRTATPTVVPGGFSPGDYVQTTANLNLRQGPSAFSPILTVVPLGGIGFVTGYPSFADNFWWYPVDMFGVGQGYMAGSFLELLEQEPTSTPFSTATPSNTPSATVTSTSTNTPGPSPTRTQTATPSATATPTHTFTPTKTATATHTPTATKTPTRTATPTTTPLPSATPTTIPGGFPPGSRVEVDVTLLNFRQSPGINATVIAQLPFGADGTVTGFPVFRDGYNWYPIAIDGYGSGWAAGEYLSLLAPTPTSTPTRTSTPFSTSTNTPGPSSTATNTLVATNTSTPSPTVAATSTRTPTATPTTIPGGFSPGSAVMASPYRLNLRSSPTIASGNVIATLPIGTVGTVTGFPQFSGGNTWYPVTMPGFGSGWVAGQYLVPGSQSPTPTRTPNVALTPTATRTMVTASTATPTTIPGGFSPGTGVLVSPYRLNLRSSPAFASGNIIAVMPIGTTGTVTGFPQIAGGYTWYPVTMGGFGSGWVAGNYLVRD